MNCIKCGHSIDPNDKFCYNCGEPVSSCEDTGRQPTNSTPEDFIICKRCGEPQPYGSIFCGSCGERIDNASNQSSAPNTVPHNYGNSGAADDTYSNRTHPNTHKTNNTFPIIMIILLALIIVLAGCTVYFLLFRSSDTEYRYDVVSHHDISPTAKPTSAPTELPLPVFDRVTASSTRGTDTEGGQYSAEAVLSKDLQTKWAPSKSSYGGINEWIEISSDSIQYVSCIQILNGYHKNPDVWRNNNRVQNCTITFSNGESRNFVLDDTMDLIELDLGGIIETKSIRLTINSLYYGTKWNDTAITYIKAY